MNFFPLSVYDELQGLSSAAGVWGEKPGLGASVSSLLAEREDAPVGCV